MTKTNILVPEPISEAAMELARQMGIPLEEFYTTAVTEYVIAHQKKTVTEALDRVYETESSTLDLTITQMQNKTLRSETW